MAIKRQNGDEKGEYQGCCHFPLCSPLPASVPPPAAVSSARPPSREITEPPTPPPQAETRRGEFTKR